MNWFNKLPLKEQEKLANDLFYFSMVQNGFSYNDLLKSSWINTNYSHEENQKNQQPFSTSIPNHVFESTKYEITILLSTGSYAPAHFGHIEMMTQAKNAIESLGHQVDMIVLSPSNDKYVLRKAEDTKEWNSNQRISHLKEKLNSYPFSSKEDKNLFVIDLWESLFCNCNINFTDVIFKIEQNFKNFLNKKIKIFYVFGSDNHSFMNCFEFIPNELKDKYFGICIERDGYPITEHKRSRNTIYSKNVIFSNEKSRTIRKELNINIHKPILVNTTCNETETSLNNFEWLKDFPEEQENLKNNYLKLIQEKTINIEMEFNH